MHFITFEKKSLHKKNVLLNVVIMFKYLLLLFIKLHEQLDCFAKLLSILLSTYF